MAKTKRTWLIDEIEQLIAGGARPGELIAALPPSALGYAVRVLRRSANADRVMADHLEQRVEERWTSKIEAHRRDADQAAAAQRILQAELDSRA